MPIQLIRFSAVIVGEAHNPTILNPDFLANEGIVPKSWGWKVQETLTTPPFAMVHYSNQVVITVEEKKLQVADPNIQKGLQQSKVTEIASAYVQTLRHVRYKSVGNNFQSIIQSNSPDTYLKERFLKAGPWNADQRNLKAVGIRLIYPLDKGRLTVSIDSGEAIPRTDKKMKQPIIIGNANFSRTCGSHPAFEEVTKFLAMANNDALEHQHLLEEILKDYDSNA